MQSLRELGPFGILLHSPGLAIKVMEAGAHVRLQSELTMVERELALLSTLREKDAAYEWSSHVGTARKAGMREEAIDAVRAGTAPAGLTPDEATFKKYRPRGLNEQGQQVFELVPLNEDYPSMRSDLTAIRIAS